VKLIRLLAILLLLNLSAILTSCRAAVILASSNADIANARGGDLCLVLPGRYPSGLIIRNAGTQAAPLIIQAATPGTAVWSGTGDGITVRAANVTLRGLATEDCTMRGIFVAGVAGVRVSGCSAKRSGITGILAGDASGVIIEDGTWTDSGTQHGIYVSGDKCDRVVVRGNVCTGNAGSGIQLNAQGGTTDHVLSDAIVEGNVLEKNGRLGAAAANLLGVTKSFIRNNRVLNNFAGGIALSSSAADHPEWGSKQNRLENNVVQFQPDTGRWCLSFTQGSSGNTVSECTLVGGKAGCYYVTSNSSVSAFANTYFLQGSAQAFWTDGSVQFSYSRWQSLGVDVGSTLLNVLPFPTVENVPNVSSTHSEGFSNHLNVLAGGIDFSDLAHLNLGQFRVRGMFSANESLLLDTVLNVVAIRSEEEMVRADARRVVALMADEHSVGDRAVSEFPRHSVGLNVLLLFGQSENAIPVRAPGSRPCPAVTRRVHVLPEPFVNGCRGLVSVVAFLRTEEVGLPPAGLKRSSARGTILEHLNRLSGVMGRGASTPAPLLLSTC